MIPQELLQEETPQVQSMLRYWWDFMLREVDFWETDGNAEVHSEGHSGRVLLLALKIGAARQLKLRSMIALCHASIFHDTRRKDNYLDVGHGDRAADYYRDFCKEHGIKYLPEVYATIKFHDRDDKLGEAYIQQEAKNHSLNVDGQKGEGSGSEAPWDDTEGWLEVFRDFKDADALDRLRLGPWMLDMRYLRTPEARDMAGYAQRLVEATIDTGTLGQLYDWTRPYADQVKSRAEKGLPASRKTRK